MNKAMLLLYTHTYTHTHTHTHIIYNNLIVLLPFMACFRRGRT